MSLKQRIAARELTVGSWLSFGYPAVCEIMATAGFDWLAIDMEHTAIDMSQAQQLIQIIDLAGCTPLVRVGENDPLAIKRPMDAGAHGVIVPMVNTPDDARRAAAAVRYPPFGTRGVGLGRAQAYGLGFEKYRAWAERETILIVQIEHIEGVDNLEQILAVDGVDGFIVGPYDLSASLGRPGDFAHPDVAAALDRVRTIMNQSRKVGGYHVVHSNRSEFTDRIEQGYRFIAYGDDMVFLAEKVGAEAGFAAGHLSGAAGRGNP